MKKPRRVREHPRSAAHKEQLMDKSTIAETTTERMIRSFMEGAESGMVEVRGYGLTASEREDAEREARALYGEPERMVA